MKLSLVFELLMIFILLAFAASKSVKKHKNHAKKGITTRDDSQLEDNSINKYCTCVENYCKCCRDFALPVIELNGPGCASLMYLNGDKMSVSLSFGKKVITNRTLSSRKPSPVCMPLPGGISKFCGRVYNIARAGEEFRACLGLELQSKSTVEAAVRVSCFKFGPRGVTSEPADPLPLVPKDEKDDDDDDDDYDDDDDEDDFGLGDDDDDDDDDGAIDAVNDVDTADYTGFSLLGEDLLGDLFGSSGTKKPNKNNNKKKQAPLQTSPTTTTWRPKPSRRPTRRPSSRTTTPRTTRTTTVRVRPASGNRRPTRRPSRRPTRRPTTSAEITSTSILTTTTTTTPKPVMTSVSVAVPTTEQIQVIKIDTEKVFDVMSVTAKTPMETMMSTTSKAVTDFEDPGLEMSLAHITGQLSVMPVTPMLPNSGKIKQTSTTPKEEPMYEKIETITPKLPPTIPFASTEDKQESVNDDMIQIVQSLDSHSAESEPERQDITAEESRGSTYNFNSASGNNYEGLTLPKKNRNNPFSLEDLDVLDLSNIGESLGSELGIFGRNKRQNKNKDVKIKNGKDESNDYDEILGTVGEGLMMMRKSANDNKNKKNRRRQNKMMRDWSQL